MYRAALQSGRMIDHKQLQLTESQTHTHTHRLIYSLVICLSSNAVDQSFVRNDSMAVDLQRKLFGLAPPHLPEELILKYF